MFNKRSVDSSHYPEVVENSGASRRVEKLKVKEHLRSSKDRLGFFCGLDTKQFQRMLGYLNSVSRRQKIEYEYKDGILPLMDTPELKNKEGLMNLVLGTLKKILGDKSLEEKRRLRLTGLTLAGALDYIHPFADGNGRTGRLMQYLIEFGTERGNEAFDEEIYALLAKLPVYDTDEEFTSIYTSPPTELERALDHYAGQSIPDYLESPKRERAAVRAELFLKMMAGEIVVPIPEDVRRRPKIKGGGIRGFVPFETVHTAGEIDGRSLYEEDYLRFSSIPNRSPEDVPAGAKRVLGEKKHKQEEVSLRSDLGAT